MMIAILNRNENPSHIRDKNDNLLMQKYLKMMKFG